MEAASSVQLRAAIGNLRGCCNLPATRLDLLHDMGPSEQIVVCGESLLYEALSDSQRVCAAQPLSVAYRAEGLLSRLRDCGGSFTVLFFRSYEGPWSQALPDCSAAASRALLQAQLSRVPGIQVREFECWSCEQFHEFLQEEHPTFAAAADATQPGFSDAPAPGSTPNHATAQELEAGDDATEPSQTGPEPGPLTTCAAAKLVLRGLLMGFQLACLEHKCSVAYMPSFSFDNVTVFGFLTSDRAIWPLLRDVPRTESYRLAVSVVLQVADAEASELPPVDTPELQRLVDRLGWRLGVGAWCCSHAVAAGGTESSREQATWLAAAYLTHLAAMDALPLEARSLQPAAVAAADQVCSHAAVSSFLAATNSALLSAAKLLQGAAAAPQLNGVQGEDVLGGAQLHVDDLSALVDAADARLFGLVLLLVSSTEGAPAAGSGEVQHSSLAIPKEMQGPIGRAWSGMVGLLEGAKGGSVGDEESGGWPLIEQVLEAGRTGVVSLAAVGIRRGMMQEIEALQAAASQAATADQGAAVGDDSKPATSAEPAACNGDGLVTAAGAPAVAAAAAGGPAAVPEANGAGAEAEEEGSDDGWEAWADGDHSPKYEQPSASDGKQQAAGVAASSSQAVAAPEAAVSAPLELAAPAAPAEPSSLMAFASAMLGALSVDVAPNVLYLQGTRVLTEGFRWQNKTEPEPVFWTQAASNTDQFKKQMKDVRELPVQELVNCEFLGRRVRNMVDKLLKEAAMCFDQAAMATKRAAARDIAVKAIEKRASRQAQMDARNSTRMAESLSGSKNVFGRRSAAAAPKPAVAESRAGSNSKADTMKAKIAKDRDAKTLKDEQARWDIILRAPKELSWTPDDIRSMLKDIEIFLASARAPQMVELATATKLLMLYQSLALRSNSSRTSSRQRPMPRSAVHAEVTVILLTLQSLVPLLAKALSAAAQEPEPESDPAKVWQQVAAPWKPELRAPSLAVAHAVLVGAGFPDMAQALLAAMVPKPRPVAELSEAAGGKAADPGKAKKGKESAKESSKDSGKSSKASSGSSKKSKEVAPVSVLAASEALKLGGLDVGVDALRFQLQHMSHLLQRPPVGPADPRVSGFVPDTWQRQVLDIVDAGSSAVVCAPTSAGKTFISSYVIGKVKQDGKDGRVVIVLPTKALVNQVAAQVYRDFEQPAGVFTRDFRTHVETSPILITVPSCLDILFMSPANRAWVGSIRYVIFDEVHCMNETGAKSDDRGMGQVWERLLMSVRCPILALSATIGNPESLSTWLQQTKTLHLEQDRAAGMQVEEAAYRVHLVLQKERYNDLLHHVFAPGYALVPVGLDSSISSWRQEAEPKVLQPVQSASSAIGQQFSDAAEAERGFQGQVLPLHPLVCCSLDSLVGAAAGAGAGAASSCSPVRAPASLPAYSALEALQLYDAMAAELEELRLQEGEEGVGERQQYLASFSRLTPQAYFGSAGSGAEGGNETAGAGELFITRPRAKQWAAELSDLVVGWCRAGGTWRAAIERLQRRLGSSVVGALQAQHSAWQQEQCEAQSARMDHMADSMALLYNLTRANMLPVILFNFSQEGCEEYCWYIRESLEKAQEVYRRKYEVQLDAKRAERSFSPAAASNAGANSDEEAEEATERDQGVPYVVIDGLTFSLDPRKPDPSFTFVPTIGSEDITDAVEELRLRWGSSISRRNSLLLEALEFGVGVHHFGLNKHYRQHVEILFRKKALQVVIATGTLAYGIHMPCRTVVFAGDSQHLDALNFRQMSGRAGRRGLDTIGHVVFHSIPRHRIVRLMVAPVPRLRGQFILTPTLLLQLLLLQQNLTDAAVTAKTKQKGTSAASLALAQPRVADNFLDCILNQPFMSTANITQHRAAADASTDPVRLQLRIALALSLLHLRRNQLITPQGQAAGLGGMCTHLFWTEPSNYVLARLLNSGAIHALLASHPPGSPAVHGELMLLMCHLFCRLPMHPGWAKYLKAQAKGRYASVVLLPPLPSNVRQVVEDYQQEVLDTTLRAVIQASQAGAVDAADSAATETTLPLSGVRCGLSSRGPVQGKEREDLLAALSSLRQPFQACSPFMALGPAGDGFDSMPDLLSSVKQTLRPHSVAVPTLKMLNQRGVELPLNSYALDFFKNGSHEDIMQATGVKEGTLWNLLTTMSGILHAVADALELAVGAQEGAAGARNSPLPQETHGGTGGSSNVAVVAAFRQLATKFSQNLEAFSVLA